MKVFAIAVVTIISVGAYLLSVSPTQAQTSSFTAKKTESPFYCNRTTLSAEERQHQKELSAALHSALLGVQELPDGYEFEFAPGRANYQALAEFTSMEQACCPFFDISIRLEREHGKLWWRLTGRDGVKPFIHAEFTSWFGGSSI
jgi:hypothetical protein